MLKVKSIAGGSLWAQIWGYSRHVGVAKSEHPRLTNGEIISEEFQPMWSQTTIVNLSNGAIGDPYDVPFPPIWGSICPQDMRMDISPQWVIRSTSCLVLGVLGIGGWHGAISGSSWTSCDLPFPKLWVDMTEDIDKISFACDIVSRSMSSFAKSLWPLLQPSVWVMLKCKHFCIII